MKKMDVLVLAGGTLPDEMQKYSSGHDNRALLKIGDKFMIEYVVDALAKAPETGRILVVGLKEPLEQALGDRAEKVMSSGDTMLENIRIGLDYFPDAGLLMIASCDIPLINPEIVSRLVEACKISQADVYYPVIEKELNEKKFPETKRTYFRLREGVFTGGNIVILNPEALRKNWELLNQAIAGRKSVMKLLSIIGIGFIFRYLLGILSIEDCERKIGKITGMRGKVVVVPDPEIGVDVDKESDYLLVKQRLG